MQGGSFLAGGLIEAGVNSGRGAVFNPFYNITSAKIFLRKKSVQKTDSKNTYRKSI